MQSSNEQQPRIAKDIESRILYYATLKDIKPKSTPASDKTTSGTLAVDGIQTFVAQTNVQGAHGVFSNDEDGDWTYRANNTVDALSDGKSVSDTFDVLATNGTLLHQVIATNDINAPQSSMEPKPPISPDTFADESEASKLNELSTEPQSTTSRSASPDTENAEDSDSEAGLSTISEAGCPEPSPESIIEEKLHKKLTSLLNKFGTLALSEFLSTDTRSQVQATYNTCCLRMVDAETLEQLLQLSSDLKLMVSELEKMISIEQQRRLSLHQTNLLNLDNNTALSAPSNTTIPESTQFSPTEPSASDKIDGLSDNGIHSETSSPEMTEELSGPSHELATTGQKHTQEDVAARLSVYAQHKTAQNASSIEHLTAIANAIVEKGNYDNAMKFLENSSCTAFLVSSAPMPASSSLTSRRYTNDRSIKNSSGSPSSAPQPAVSGGSASPATLPESSADPATPGGYSPGFVYDMGTSKSKSSAPTRRPRPPEETNQCSANFKGCSLQ
jgi:VCBS repeat-containing protein